MRYPIENIRFCHICGVELRVKRGKNLGESDFRKTCWKDGLQYEGNRGEIVSLPMEEVKYCPVTGMQARFRKGREALNAGVRD